jgi:ABC-2 type transport system ATP-binding protein
VPDFIGRLSGEDVAPTQAFELRPRIVKGTYRALTNVIETQELHKRFTSGGKTVIALNHLSIRIPQGGVYGILGQNGAGKSTLFRIILGLMRPNAGSVRVLERRPGHDTSLCWEVGAMIETPHFFNFMTAEQTVQMLARLRGSLPGASPKALLERVGLAEAADRKVHGFSVGMKQRLGIAAALLSRPRLVILDEPTSGMDPIGIQEIRHLIRELSIKDGVTVVLASHQLEEVTKLCDRVSIKAPCGRRAGWPPCSRDTSACASSLSPSSRLSPC